MCSRRKGHTRLSDLKYVLEYLFSQHKFKGGLLNGWSIYSFFFFFLNPFQKFTAKAIDSVMFIYYSDLSLGACSDLISLC